MPWLAPVRAPNGLTVVEQVARGRGSVAASAKSTLTVTSPPAAAAGATVVDVGGADSLPAVSTAVTT